MSPRAAEVEVWELPPQAPPAAEGLLGCEERERAARLRDAAARRRFVATHAALRRVLASACGEAPAALRFALGPNGKPWLPTRPDLGFNLSHAGDCALLALSPGALALGIDVEHSRPLLDPLRLARRFFTLREAESLSALAEPERSAAFLACWTRKEAWVKAQGLGMPCGLDRAELGHAPGARRAPALDGRSLFVLDLDVGPGRFAALACEGEAPPCVRRRAFHWDDAARRVSA